MLLLEQIILMVVLRVCHAPTAWGMQQAFGTGAATNSVEDLKQTDAVFLFGANPIKGHPVTGAKD